MILGKAIFTSRPKLSTFMCAFMIIAILALYGVTLLVKTMVNEAYYNYTYFTSLPGRVVITNNDRKPISNEELELIKQETNAKKCYSFDFLFDEDSYCYIYNPDKYANRGRPIALDIVIDEGFGENIYGRYPEKADEVFLYIPIGVRSSYSTEQLLKEKIILKDFSVFRIVGVKYFYDNNKQGKALLTHDGFNALSFMTYISRNASYTNISATIYDNGNIDLYSADNLCISFSDQKGEIYIEDILFKEDLEAGKISNFTLELSYTFEKYYYGYYRYIEAEVKTLTYSKELSIDDLYSEMPNNLHGDNINNGMSIFVISIDIINDIMDNYMTDIYNQASIFYKDNNEAKKQISKLKDMGYIATLSYEEVPNDALEVLGVSIIKLIAYVLYILAVLFIAIFVYLCTSKSLLAFKSDISIFRSMGIKSNEIKMGMFFRMFICLIPAFIFFAIASILVIFVPALNDQFTFLYFQDYFLIILGMILISLYVTSRQLKKLYKISVKESLKGEIE